MSTSRSPIPALFLAAALAASGLSPAALASEIGEEGDDMAVRGRMVAPGRAVLSAQVSAPIRSVTRRVGETFKRGDTLVAFDCRRIEAQVAAARAVVAATETTLASVRRMHSLKSVGEADVELAEAELRKARAELLMHNVDAGFCTVAAPFDGRVVARMVAPHESVAAGSELLAIVDEGDMEVEVLVPSTWLRFITVGLPFTLAMDATGLRYSAEVTRLGGEIDPVSQSVQVFGRLTPSEDGILTGMSGRVTFDHQKARP
ncbi:MAG: efflux RND transporter periplasmic adaptor subunit [Rhodospirillaceae bacterium]